MASTSDVAGVDRAGEASGALGRPTSLTSKTSKSLLRVFKKPLGRSLSARMRQVSLASIKAMPELCDNCYELVYTPGSWSRGRRFANRSAYPVLGLTIAKITVLQSEACELCRALLSLSGCAEEGALGWELREFPLIMTSDFNVDTDVPSFMAVVPWNFGTSVRVGEREDQSERIEG